jgi:hypothetical protein
MVRLMSPSHLQPLWAHYQQRVHHPSTGHSRRHVEAVVKFVSMCIVALITSPPLVGIERELLSSALCKQAFEEGKEHRNIAGAFLEDKIGLWREWPTSQERVGGGSQRKGVIAVNIDEHGSRKILFSNGQFHGVVAIRTSFPVPNRSTVWSQLTGCRECVLSHLPPTNKLLASRDVFGSFPPSSEEGCGAWPPRRA